MGSKSGGGQSTPYEAPNSLSSAQSLRIIDAISEGVVAGFANGDDAPLKSVFFDDTPVQNPDGSFNFKGVAGFFQRGTPDQSYVPGFDASERTVAVSANVKHAAPIVRAVTDPLVSRLRITVGVERNSHAHDNGDVLATNTSLAVELVGQTGSKVQNVSFTEKSSGAYYQDVEFDALPSVPFNIRVRRLTADSTTDRISNNTFFASYVEIIDAKLSYPHTALAALSIDSDQFGSNVPRRNYLLKGKLVKVPSNYDPETRSYGAGIWDGSFKTAWTNNPAWVFYDVLTQPRYSTLARRLQLHDIDKWSLYQIARYCDELVDDGFGGKEPRFVCNAYLTEARQAGELLQDLASVFTGLPVWNGNQVSVVLDKHTDPVALYNNSNVVDGLFNYSGAAFKSIHTAVHVQYVDKYDGYRAKTEYVADQEAIKRYGLNIKQIQAFGCDSRGQAARFGAWTLQTELRQQNMVTFSVGREGLQHLPYDIVQVMDNAYAGAELSGRVAAVSGSRVKLDRAVADATDTVFYYPVSGSLKAVKVVAQPEADTLVLAEAPEQLSAHDTWILSGKVKPRLYRAVGIKENTEDGTYTVTALLHDPAKYDVVDNWANFDRHTVTLHTLEPVVQNAALTTADGAVVLTWDNLTANGEVLSYDIKIYKDGKLYRHIPDADRAEIRLGNLPNGDYRAEIRGRNSRGVYSEPLVKAWTLDYRLTNLQARPRTMAIELSWALPQTVAAETYSEIWYSTDRDIQTAKKLAALPYPQNGYTLTGVAVTDTYWFWVRMTDQNGITGEFTSAVIGRADPDPAPIVAQIQGAITQSALSSDLIAQLAANDAAAQSAAIAQAAKDVAAKLAAEAAARNAAIKAEADKAAQALLDQANELGTRIGTVENVNNSQAQQISTLTAAQGQTAAGLEAEKKARADGDQAEAQAREVLAAKVSGNTAAISQEQNARIEADRVQTERINNMQGRLGEAESSITALSKTVADHEKARAEELRVLTAKMGASGGNLLPDSDFKYGLSKQIHKEADGRWYLRGVNKSGYTIDGRNVGFVEQRIQRGQDLIVEFNRVPIERGKCYQISCYVQQITNNVSKTSVYYRPLVGDKWNADGVKQKVLLYQNNVFNPEFSGLNSMVRFVTNVMITDTAPADRMSVALSLGYTTDESESLQLFTMPMICEVASLDAPPVPYSAGPDPDNPTALLMTVQADLNSWRSAQADKDAATTAELRTAIARIGQNESNITDLANTRASKTEVVSLARQGLQSEWQGFANQAKDQAVAAAQADATQKANAAKLAADIAAQATADAAKAQAIAVASNDATAKANAANAQAIADAAAKDLVLKQQAADDAKVKADNAKADAIAEARKLNNATNATISALQKTVADNDQARAEESRQLRADFNKSGGGVNLLVDSEYSSRIVWRSATTLSDAMHLGRKLIRVDANTAGAIQLGVVQSPEKGLTKLTKGEEYTLSLNVQGTAGIQATGLNYLYLIRDRSEGGNYRLETISITHSLSNRISIKFIAPWSSNTVRLLIGANGTFATTDWFAFHSVKLERGVVATDWTPAPEDTDMQISTVQAELNNFKSTQATKDQAAATQVGNLATRVGKAESTLTQTSTTVSSLNGKVQSLYTLKVQAVGNRKAIAGLALGADGQTGDSQMLIYADKFALVQPNTTTIKAPFVVTTVNNKAQLALSGDMLVDGVIQGKHIASGQTLSSPVINGGSLNIGNGRFLVNSSGQVSIAASSGNVGLKINNERIDVYDEKGVLRVRLGKLS